MDLHRIAERIGLIERLRRRRLRIMNDALQGALSPEGLRGRRILEIGCGNGRDFLRHVAARRSGELHGVDRSPWTAPVPGVSFCVADARALPFPYGYFDLAVSIGLVDELHSTAERHDAICEMLRVARSYCIVSGLHRGHDAVSADAPLDWSQLPELAGSVQRRFHYVPGIVANLVVASTPRGSRRRRAH